MNLSNIIPAQMLFLQVEDRKDYDELGSIVEPHRLCIQPLDIERSLYKTLNRLHSEFESVWGKRSRFQNEYLNERDSQLDQFQVTLAKPLPDGGMLVLVVGNNFPRSGSDNRGFPAFNLHSQWRWQPKPVGIPGWCAATKEPKLRPDEGDKSNSWPYGGTISLPVLDVTKGKGSGCTRCKAVLSVHSSESGIFTNEHIRYLEKYVDSIRNIMIESSSRIDRGRYNGANGGGEERVQIKVPANDSVDTHMTAEQRPAPSHQEQVSQPEESHWETDEIITFLNELSADDKFLDSVLNSQFGEALRKKFEGVTTAHTDLAEQQSVTVGQEDKSNQHGQDRYQPDPDVQAIIDQVVNDIRNNPHTPEPRRTNTNYETVLRMFKECGRVDSDEIKALVSHTNDPNTKARQLIHRLDGKLGAHGCGIHRVSQYYISKDV